MAVVQSTYSERIKQATAGLIANMRNWDGITRTCETVAGVGFGLAVGRGDTDPEKGAKLGGALTDFLGVSHRDVTLEVRAAIDKYAQYENMGVLTSGEIWVVTSVDATSDDSVHYDTTTGIFKVSGGIGPVAGARFMGSSVTVSGVKLVRLHLSADQAAA